MRHTSLPHEVHFLVVAISPKNGFSWWARSFTNSKSPFALFTNVGRLCLMRGCGRSVEKGLGRLLGVDRLLRPDEMCGECSSSRMFIISCISSWASCCSFVLSMADIGATLNKLRGGSTACTWCWLFSS